VQFRTSGTDDPYPVEQLAIARWDNTYFQRTGTPVDLNGRTGAFVTDR
jgi:hypothetical protein